MGLRQRFDRLLGLGPADEPRAIAVEGKRRLAEVPVVSTPGARVRICRTGRDGEVIRFLSWCHHRGLPVELVDDGRDTVSVDGREMTPAEAKKQLA